jgi:hypothetical protein
MAYSFYNIPLVFSRRYDILTTSTAVNKGGYNEICLRYRPLVLKTA